MKKVILTILCIVFVTGCEAIKHGMTHPGPPWQAWMYEGPPPGREYTPVYVHGWKDGCHTGAAASGNHYYKFHFDFRQDAILAQNAVYYKGWKDAFDYCQRYLFQYQRRPVL